MGASAGPSNFSFFCLFPRARGGFNNFYERADYAAGFSECHTERDERFAGEAGCGAWVFAEPGRVSEAIGDEAAADRAEFQNVE